MSQQTKKRIRDPVYGLIVFDLSDPIDRTAWELINIPEFQRLRRVKQLGVSEFTFPGATHTRFSHCVGVYHVARKLMKVARTLPKLKQNEPRERVALLASLLHDLGHGPFSHAFEQSEKVRLRSQTGAYKDHVQWTAEIIKRPKGGVRRVLLASMADEIAELLTSEPSDIYAAVVSSSFDADRLDYLQRDKLMTGSGAGGIDFQWLMDNLQTTTIQSETEEGEDEEPPSSPIETFCFAEKAAQAAEAFILARYHLYSQVYFHHTTRGFEQLLSAFLAGLATVVANQKFDTVCISADHPLAVYYAAEKPSVDQYLALDDTSVWSAIESASRGKDSTMQDLSVRLRDRGRLKAIEMETDQPTSNDKARRDFIETDLKNEIGNTIFVDRAPLTVYDGLKAGEARPHKRVRIKGSGDEIAVDITKVSKAIAALTEKQELLRYYFIDEQTCRRVMEIKGNP